MLDLIQFIQPSFDLDFDLIQNLEKNLIRLGLMRPSKTALTTNLLSMHL